MKSHAELVKEFTEESKGIKVPEKPIPMSKESVRFLAKMMMSEVVEMLETYHNKETAKCIAHVLINEDFDEKKDRTPDTLPKSDVQIIEEQMDAMVDCYYYALDSAAKHGMNLEPVFTEVHNANMKKRDPKTGKFIRREDGKVVKPEGWTPANINQVVQQQLAEGGFPSIN